MAKALEAVDAALDSISERDDGQPKFEAASRLTEWLAERGERAAALRRQIITAIRDKEQLKLRALADRVGMSTTRLHQLISGGKKDRKDDGDA